MELNSPHAAGNNLLLGGRCEGLVWRAFDTAAGDNWYPDGRNEAALGS